MNVLQPDQIHNLLIFGVQQNASDLHLRVGEPPIYRIAGKLTPLNVEILKDEDTKAICTLLLKGCMAKPDLNVLTEYDGSYEMSESARFRINIYRQKDSLAIVVRIIKTTIPSMDSLQLPASVKSIAEFERGLVLVTGATGSGKSTSLAAIINHINFTRKVHILTLEDPIEFVYQRTKMSETSGTKETAKATISQREIGKDTPSFVAGLKGALRQDPDVILLGEMRDIETIDIGLKAAETGHLVFATVHTTDAAKTIGRLLSVFPPEAQMGVRYRLADTLKASLSQRLLPLASGKGRALAAEIMITTPLIQDLIRDPLKTAQIKEAIEQGRNAYGSQSFDQHLLELYKGGKITREIAMETATSPADLARQISLAGGGAVDANEVIIQRN